MKILLCDWRKILDIAFQFSHYLCNNLSAVLNVKVYPKFLLTLKLNMMLYPKILVNPKISVNLKICAIEQIEIIFVSFNP